MNRVTNAVHLSLMLTMVVTLTVLGAGFVSAADKPKQVVIGYQPFPTADIVVKDQQLNEKTFGVPVKWVPVSSGMQAHQALASGSLDFALLGSSPTAAAVAKGIPISVIWIHDIIGDNEALIAKNDANIKSVVDLKGKTVAAPFGATTHYHLLIALMLNNINDSDLTIINLEPNDIPPAWKKDEIDAAFVWEPVLNELRELDGQVILTSKQLAERGFPTGDLGVVRKEFAAAYPDIVVQYLKNLDAAVKLSREKPDFAAMTVVRQLGLSPQQAEKQMRGVFLVTAREQNEGKHFGGEHWNFGLYTVLKETADFLQKVGVVKTLPPREAFMEAVDARFLVQASEEP
jgi:taurine transport system substrate-binding protein